MLKGKVVLITGSTGGIGFETARMFAREGCAVMLNGLEGDAAGRDRAGELASNFGVDADFNGADLRRSDQVAALVEATVARFGAIDILVNNAAVRHFGPIEGYRPEDWEESMIVNVNAPFFAIRAALPHMKSRNWGRIVNMASALSFFAQTDRADYITTKTALLGLTRAVALELAKTGVTCNSVCPGTVLTQAVDSRIVAMIEKEGISREEAVRRFMVGRAPSGNFVSQESVAAMIVYLCGPYSDHINGAAMSVDSGWTAGR